jgi:hypothetical protein
MEENKCQVVGCEKPKVTSFVCKVQIKDSDKMVTESIGVCTEHQKAFEVLGKGKDRFYN